MHPRPHISGYGSLHKVHTGLHYREQISEDCADKLFNDFSLKFSFPSMLHHDMGREFENRLMARLKELSGIQGSHMTLYQPQGNRFNQILLSILYALVEEEGLDSLAKVIPAYNCTKNESLGYTLYYPIFEFPMPANRPAVQH